ncbi:uncharacterized protein LOC109845026 isoform X1 [Asparagus officinalis]|uniref:uncharacterized protein LOC109845026 isoform X1 n=2 Tax=Asparagus officinalis TaxID=4686 RepID=UPI00098E49DB|nr:uncharacterized protein LOC109845026 isoform X1 [Asparagus officinalis]
MARIKTYLWKGGPSRVVVRPSSFFASGSGSSAGKSGGKCRWREDDPRISTVTKLRRREIGERPRVSRGIGFYGPERLGIIQLQEEFDMYDDNIEFFDISVVDLEHLRNLQRLKKRSKIAEIVAVKDIIFVLSESGRGAAFSLQTKEHLCFLNTSPDQVIKGIFYNKCNESLITTWKQAPDPCMDLARFQFRSYRCNSTPMEYIGGNQLDLGFPLFGTEANLHSYVELDDINAKALTYDVSHRMYKVYELKNYSLLYSISNSDLSIGSIKMSPGILQVVYRSSCPFLKLKLLSSEDGKELKSFRLELHPEKSIEFVKHLDEKVIIKQEEENLQILDVFEQVRTLEIVDANHNRFIDDICLLHGRQIFLTFSGRKVNVWNCEGKLITEFEDHDLWYPKNNFNKYYVSSDGDVIISYCMPKGDLRPAVHFSSIHTGKRIAKVTASNPRLDIDPTGSDDGNYTFIQSLMAEALENVTAIFYDEEQDILYTGNNKGLVHAWHS